jgi:hypothetical protein
MPQASAHHPFHVLRLWHGMTLPVLLRILARYRFAVSPRRLHLVLLGLLYSIPNWVMKIIQDGVLGRRIGACELAASPIFIVGHWRTGTTYLHELLALDEHLLAPTTLECLAPAQCLAAGWWVRKLAFLVPTMRPMDNMPVGFDLPQEDELALLSLGLRSPYEAMLFPNNRQVGQRFFDLSELTPPELGAWKSAFANFLRMVTLRGSRARAMGDKGRRLILKSPPHTARLRVLREMFPAAQFIHLVRDPGEVFVSTVRLWRALFDTQGCQEPDYGALPNGAPAIESYVLDDMNLLYRDFFSEAARIPAKDFCQVRYEDLVRSPLVEIERIYEQLGIDSFERVRPRLEAKIRERAGYQRNALRISAEQRLEVYRRWRWYAERFGYGGEQ